MAELDFPAVAIAFNKFLLRVTKGVPERLDTTIVPAVRAGREKACVLDPMEI
ncbi:MAG: hypothetical protein SGI77_00835 [Pirellulaceae bacterium]|nr:hypothetical protein [Pirellulaceae bacterium]